MVVLSEEPNVRYHPRFYRLNLAAAVHRSTPNTHTHLSLAMAHNDVGGVGAGPSSSDVDEKDVYVRMRGAPPTSAPSSANLISGDAAAAPPPPKPRTAAFATSNPQFGNNRIATTKYSCLNFLPRSLFEQYVLVVIMCGCMYVYVWAPAVCCGSSSQNQKGADVGNHNNNRVMLRCHLVAGLGASLMYISWSSPSS